MPKMKGAKEPAPEVAEPKPPCSGRCHQDYRECCDRCVHHEAIAAPGLPKDSVAPIPL